MVASIPNIALYGFMGCGKSTLGKRLADAFQLSFVDLDRYIEKKAAKAIHTIFSEHGESYFRDLEHESLLNCCRETMPRVLSLGGGSLLREDSHKILKEKYSIYTLMVPFAILEKRLLLSLRPLRNDARNVFEARVEHYQSIGTPIFLSEESVDVSYQKLVEVGCAA